MFGCDDLGLGDLLFGSSEADLKAFDLATPAFALGLGDAVSEVAADSTRRGRCAGSGLSIEYRTRAQPN